MVEPAAAKTARIGWLSEQTLAESAAFVDAFRAGLRDLGRVEGRDVEIEFRSSEGRADRLAELAGMVLRRHPDVLVTEGTLATRAARQATSSVPIVMAFSADPVGAGLVATLAKPGGNVTGLTSLAGELSGKRLQLLKEVVPGVSRVGALFNPATTAARIQLAETESAARTLGLIVHAFAVRGGDDVGRAFAAMQAERIEALTVMAEPLIAGLRPRIVEQALKARLPTVFYRREWAQAGGLMVYGVNYPDLCRRAATYVDRILKGARPGDLPVERPTTFDLVINLKTARMLGLTVPPSVLMRAVEIIE